MPRQQPPGYGGWGPPIYPPAPPAEPPKPPPGTTETGVPFAQRGKIGLDTASYLEPEGRHGAASFELWSTIPVADAVFIEAVVPMGWAVPFGNPTVGAHYVGQAVDRFWITGGLALGIPLVEDDDFFHQSIPRAYWNMHHYVQTVFPVQFQLGLEYHASIVELRAQLEPSVWAPLGTKVDPEGAFQHAVEIQLGHSIGGGLRVQGVVVGPGDDNYQFALSPFFVIRRDLGFLRMGLMLPMDEELGPPFVQTWGFLLATGIHID